MDEAAHSLPPRPSYVLTTLAKQAAKQAVKQRLRDRGLRPQHVRASEINGAAQVYFEGHGAELLEEAWRKMQGYLPGVLDRPLALLDLCQEALAKETKH